jgi:hypothetical protein
VTTWSVKPHGGALSVSVRDESGKLTDADAARLADAVAIAHTVKPLAGKPNYKDPTVIDPPRVNVEVTGRPPDRDTKAWVKPGDAAAGFYRIQVVVPAMNEPERKGWHPPATEGVHPATATVVHEYGHLQDFGPGSAKNAAAQESGYRPGPAPAAAASVSRYAKTNADEAVAESFAEWALSGGTTTNAFVQQQARQQRWR